MDPIETKHTHLKLHRYTHTYIQYINTQYRLLVSTQFGKPKLWITVWFILPRQSGYDTQVKTLFEMFSFFSQLLVVVDK